LKKEKECYSTVGKKAGIRTEDKDEKYEPTGIYSKHEQPFLKLRLTREKNLVQQSSKVPRFQIVVVKQTNCSKAELSGESAM